MKIHLSPYFNRLPGRVSFATLAATLLLSGCAYFNTVYNAKKYYELGVAGAGDVGRLAADKELPVNVQDDFSKAIKNLSRSSKNSLIQDMSTKPCSSLGEATFTDRNMGWPNAT